MAVPVLVEPVGSGYGGAGRRGSRSGSRTSLERTGGRTSNERPSNEQDDHEEDNRWMPDHDPRDERGEFASRAQFLFTVIGFTLANGNIWHFPAAMFYHGRASILVMYSICMAIYGAPMLYLEMMIGQASQVGPMRALGLNFPLLRGVGWAVCSLSFLRAINISYLNAITLLYSAELPVFHKNKTCMGLEDWLKTPPGIEVPSREYFRVIVRGVPASWTEANNNGKDIEFSFGSGRMIASYCIVWIFACFCLLRRVRWIGKLSLFIVAIAGVGSFAFLCAMLTRPGADVGLQTFFKLNFTKFMQFEPWREAIQMTRTSLSLGMGGMISMSSYNKRGSDAFSNSITVCVVSVIASFMSGLIALIVYANVRDKFPYFVWNYQKKDGSTYRLYFAHFPEVIEGLPFDDFWSFLYYGVLLGLGITTFFGLLEMPISALTDQFKFAHKHRPITIILLCFLGLGAGIIQCTRIDYHIFTIIDKRVVPFMAEITVLLQLLTIACYGPHNFYRDINASMGKKVNFFGYFVSPYGLIVRVSQFLLSPVLIIGELYLLYRYQKENVWKRMEKVLKPIPSLPNTLCHFVNLPWLLVIIGALVTIIKHFTEGKPLRELLHPDPMHPSIRYKVPPPLGHFFGLKPIEAMPSAMGDDGKVEFPDKGTPVYS